MHTVEMKCSRHCAIVSQKKEKKTSKEVKKEGVVWSEREIDRSCICITLECNAMQCDDHYDFIFT